MIPFSSRPTTQTTTHITTTTTTLSDHQQHQQHQQQNYPLFYMSQNITPSDNFLSYNSNNISNINIATTNQTIANTVTATATTVDSNSNSSPIPCYYILREECVGDLEEELRRRARAVKDVGLSNSNQLRRNLPQQNSIIKPVIVERHGILPLSNQDSNTTLGKLKNYTNSNIGIMITTQTTSEPLSKSPHYPITQHDQSAVQKVNLQLSNNQIFQQPNQQPFQTHVSNNTTITNTTSTTIGSSLTNFSHVINNTNSTNTNQHVLGGMNVSNNSNGQMQQTSNALLVHTTSSPQQDAILNQIFDEEQDVIKNSELDELLAVGMDDNSFLQSPTINTNNIGNMFYSGSNIGGAASSSPLSPPTVQTNLFESKVKKEKKRGKSAMIHVEIPPPLLAPNQPALNSPQNNSIGGTPSYSTTNKKVAKTSKKKRKQSAASSSSMPSSSTSTNTNDQHFFFGSGSSTGGNLHVLPMFPPSIMNGEEGGGPDEESNAPPRRKRGRPPTV